MTHLEAEYDEEQTQWLLAYSHYESGLGQHGFSMDEATSPLADPNNYDSPLRFVADPPITDWAMKARLDFIDQQKAAMGDDANLNGLIWPVRKVGG